MNTDHESPSYSPLIGITTDLMIRKDRPTSYLAMTYGESVLKSGGIPVMLPPVNVDIAQLINRFDGFILSGGDDPVMEPFGQPTHPKVTRVLPERQSFETALISALHDQPEKPLLGICLGMQMMALVHGGEMDQYMPETCPTHEHHWDQEHEIQSIDESVLGSGVVWSTHKQTIIDAAHYRVLATAPDGVIEAFDDTSRVFTMGIQWHPERTKKHQLGQLIFDRFVDACRMQHAKL